mgnify:CR=1 FL=1
MIGLSVSFCVRDVAKGVAPAFDKIFAGTSCTTAEEWDDVIARYKEVYWRGLDNAEAICRQLIADGKIVQTRLETGKAPYVGQGHWVESEDQIQWS